MSVFPAIEWFRSQFVIRHKGQLGIYKIKNGGDGWMYTYCLTDFSSLTKANQANNYMIKPAIRLIKYWNANKNYKAISSYELERKIVAYYSIDRCQDYDTKRYLLNGLKQLQSIPMFDFQRDRVVKAIIAVQEAINDESNY